MMNEQPVKYERVFHSLKVVKAKRTKGLMNERANELYQQDRCNYCYVNDYFYKHACKGWMKSCFPEFIEQEEMEIW